MTTPYRKLTEQFIDFFLPLKPIPVIIRITAVHWDRDQFLEQIKTHKLKKYFGYNVRIVDVDYKQLGTVAMAMDFLRREIL